MGLVSPVDVAVMERDDGPTRWILLNRPKMHNAVDLETARAWAASLSAVANDPTIRAVVLAGEGPSFSSGGDLRAFRETENRQAYLSCVASAIGEGVRTIATMDKPVIAAIHGNAMGVGFSMFLAADYKMVAEGTKMAMSYLNVGLTPGGGGTWLLSRLVGISKAMEMILLAEPIDAWSAFEIGIVNRVVPPDELRNEAQAVAEHFARGPSRALAQTKQLMWSAQSDTLADHLELEAETIGRAATTSEFEEGSTAFFQHRRPEFN